MFLMINSVEVEDASVILLKRRKIVNSKRSYSIISMVFENNESDQSH